MESMLAVQVDEIRRPMELRTIAVPDIGDDDALVKVVSSGICRTDWHVWNGDWSWAGVEIPTPIVLGHEICGVVESVGANVSGLSTGTRVCVPFNYADGVCPYCRKGLQNLCENASWPFMEPGCGGFAQYVKVPNAQLNCVPLPENVSDNDGAALGCRYMTAYRAVRSRAQVRAGETLVVVGAGGVGRAVVQIAVAMGALVIAVDTKPSALEAAKQLGADDVVDASGLKPDEVAEQVKQLTDGKGTDVAIDALGGSASTLAALRSLGKGGRLTIAGLTTQEDRGKVTIPVDELVFGEWSLVGSLGNPHSDYPELLDLVNTGKLQPSRLVSEEVALGGVQSVFERMPSFDTDGFVVITDFN